MTLSFRFSVQTNPGCTMAMVEDAVSVAHACALPVSDEQLWEMRARFIAAGLSSGEHIVYLDDGTVDAVLERLADDRVPTRSPIESGQFAIVPAQDIRAAMRAPAPVLLDTIGRTIDTAIQRGYPGVRLTGDTGSAFQQGDGASLLEFETRIDAVLAERPARIMCFYDRSRFSEAAIEQMRAVHHTEVVAPAVYDDGLLRLTGCGTTARVAGEVDHSNRPRIRKVLETALDEALRSHSGSTDIVLDLSSLRFLDVAGAVSLVHAAEEFPSTHRLVLTGVRAGVLRLLDRCGAPFAAQLVVQARPDEECEEVPGELSDVYRRAAAAS